MPLLMFPAYTTQETVVSATRALRFASQAGCVLHWCEVLPRAGGLFGVRLRTHHDFYNSCSLHCSSFFWFNHIYIKDPKRKPPKGTTMETIGCTLTHTIAPSFGVGLFRTSFGLFLKVLMFTSFSKKGGFYEEFKGYLKGVIGDFAMFYTGVHKCVVVLLSGGLSTGLSTRPVRGGRLHNAFIEREC